MGLGLIRSRSADLTAAASTFAPVTQILGQHSIEPDGGWMMGIGVSKQVFSASVLKGAYIASHSPSFWARIPVS